VDLQMPGMSGNIQVARALKAAARAHISIIRPSLGPLTARMPSRSAEAPDHRIATRA
jgi:CheY-like chemotaxis protein